MENKIVSLLTQQKILCLSWTKMGSKIKTNITFYQHFICQFPYKGNMFAETHESRHRKLGIPRRNTKIPLLQAMSVTLIVTDKLETFPFFNSK
jgi:hypothetical protein